MTDYIANPVAAVGIIAGLILAIAFVASCLAAALLAAMSLVDWIAARAGRPAPVSFDVLDDEAELRAGEAPW